MKWTYLLLLIFIGCNSATPEMSSLSGQVTPGGTSAGTPTGNPGGTTGTPQELPGIKIKLNVSGMGAIPLELSLNGESQVSVSQDGEYTFPKRLSENGEYHVKIIKPSGDRNCVVASPMGEVSTSDVSIHVNCAPIGQYFVGGLISGTFLNPVVIKVNDTLYTISHGQSYLVPSTFTNISSVSLITTNNECSFSNGSLIISPTEIVNGRFDIWCGKASDGGSYSIKLNVSGLDPADATNQIMIGNSFDNSSRTYTNGFSEVISGARTNKRYVLEIIGSPTNKRCYFKQSANRDHFLGFSPISNHTFEVTCAPRTAGSCEAISTELPAVDGKLNDVACAKGYIAYAGSFTRTGRQYGIVPLGLVSGATGLTSKVFDRIHGTVNKIIPDGKSGYFVAGNFQKVGNIERKNLVRLTKDLIVDTDFSAGTNGEILDMIYQDNELFLFGNFSKIVTDNEFVRPGFAKLNLNYNPEKVSGLTIPELSPLTKVSASLIDWNIYFHAEYLNPGKTTTSYIVNKTSGEIKKITSPSSENGNTLYWKDTENKVWMINIGLGLVDPETMAPHPRQLDPDYLLGRNRLYTLTSSGLLYQSSLTDILVSDLTTLAAKEMDLKKNFGVLGTSPFPIQNAGTGFENQGKICFLQRPNSGPIAYGSGVPTPSTERLGVGCYLPTGEVSFPVSDFAVYATNAFSNGTKVIINSQFYDFSPNKALSLVLENGTPKLLDYKISPSFEIKSIETNGTMFYLGGNFVGLPLCSNCKRLALFDPSSASFTYPWTFLLSDGEVTKLSYSNIYLFAATTSTGNGLIGINSTGNLAHIDFSGPVTDVMAYYNNVAFTVGSFHYVGVPNFTSSQIQASIPVDAYGEIGFLNNQFIFPDNFQTLRFYDNNLFSMGNLTVPEFNPNTLRLTSVGNYILCRYNGLNGATCTNRQGSSSFSSGFYPSIVDTNFNVFQGIANYLFLGKERSAPVVLVPDIPN